MSASRRKSAPESLRIQGPPGEARSGSTSATSGPLLPVESVAITRDFRSTAKSLRVNPFATSGSQYPVQSVLIRNHVTSVTTSRFSDLHLDPVFLVSTWFRFSLCDSTWYVLCFLTRTWSVCLHSLHARVLFLRAPLCRRGARVAGRRQETQRRVETT